MGKASRWQGADVTLYQLTAGELGVLPKVEAIDRKTTGADGAFVFAVGPGTKSYREGRVIARKEGLALAWAEWPMMEDQRLDVRLGEPKELAGDVVDEAGRPIAEAEVHIAMAKIGRGEDRRELRSAGFLQDPNRPQRPFRLCGHARRGHLRVSRRGAGPGHDPHSRHVLVFARAMPVRAGPGGHPVDVARGSPNRGRGGGEDWRQARRRHRGGGS